MLHSKNLIVVPLAISLFSCHFKKTEVEKPKVSIETDRKIEILSNSLVFGGQPGAIYLKGLAAKADDSGPVERITIEQSVGASSVQTTIEKERLPKFKAAIQRSENYKPSKFDAYLNVGCDLENDPRIAGMKEEKNKPNKDGQIDTFGNAAMMVDKIFICGSVVVNDALAVLNVNEVYLDNADINMQMIASFFHIKADLLSLEGKNQITTRGMSGSAASFVPASSITLEIFENLTGTGTLNLKSIGGDYYKEKK
jgi:hypothetical protein